MVKFYVVKGLNLFGGPQAGFLVSTKTNNQNTKNYYNTFDLSVITGIGYQLENGFFFDFRYVVGLSNVGKNEIPYTASNLRAIGLRNSVYEISVGYKF